MVEIEVEEINFEPQVTKENLPTLRRQIAELRETKGREIDTLKLSSFVRNEAIKLEQWEDVAGLWWEDSLVWQHIIMFERDKLVGEKDEERVSEALKKMESAAIMADSYIRIHNLTGLKADSLRFLGRVKTYQEDYSTARAFYQEGIGLYERMDNPLRKARRLELQGFLANAMIMEGEIEEGIKLGINTFSDYDSVEEGKKLKNIDYFTWAVWKSGAIINIYHGLIDKGVIANYKDKLKPYLDEAESILAFPENDETRRDKYFQFRKDEISKIRRIIEK